MSLSERAIRGLRVFRQFIKYYWATESEPLNDYLIKWIAHLLRRPEESPRAAIVLVSGSGERHRPFIEFLSSVIGDNRSAIVNNVNALLINTMTYRDRRFVGVISSNSCPNMTVRFMSHVYLSAGANAVQVGGRSVPVRCGFVVVVPSIEGIRIEPHDNTLLIIEPNDPSPEVAAQLPRVLRKEAAAAVKDYLEQVDLGGFNYQNLPYTSIKYRTMLSSLESPVRMLVDSLLLGQRPDWAAGEKIDIPVETLYEHYKVWCKERGFTQLRIEAFCLYLKKIFNMQHDDKSFREDFGMAEQKLRDYLGWRLRT